jgi:DNA-binding MarR family transcriptional regulator
MTTMTTTREELLIGGNDSAFRDLVHGMLALSARHEEIRNGHGAYIGLPGAQYTVLIAISHLSEQPATIKAIAQHLRVTSTFITAETNKLRRAGLITKIRSAADSRVVQLQVTDAGSALLDRLSLVQQQVNDRQFARLTREEFLEFSRLVKLMIENSDDAIAFQKFITSVVQDRTTTA